ncbi:MAG: hypothetical protein AAGI48_03995 [Verrucomicrobiota bacterium]
MISPQSYDETIRAWDTVQQADYAVLEIIQVERKSRDADAPPTREELNDQLGRIDDARRKLYRAASLLDPAKEEIARKLQVDPSTPSKPTQ